MTTLRTRALLPAVVLALLAACSDSGEDRDDPFFDVSDAPARYAAVAQAFAREARASGAPGAALGVVEDGELVYAVGVGRKVPGGSVRTGSTSLFRIGSITKMITALAVLQEVDAGRVTLDDAVVQHVPGFHLSGDDVSGLTVRELLDQTAALNDYLEVNAPEAEHADSALASFLTGRFADLGYLMAPPGRFYNYSNPNYMLAGLVAESSSGLLYRQLLDQRIFTPLGMDRTFFSATEVLADGDYAEGVTTPVPEEGIPGIVLPGSYDNAWGRPAGYAWSSVTDLARFARFLLDGDPTLLSPALHAQMTNPDHDTQELLDLLRYGYGLHASPGFFLDGWRPSRVLEHDGAIAGYSSYLLAMPEQRFALVMLASGDRAAPFPDTLLTALRTLPALPAPVAGPDVSPDPATFVEEVGTYEDPHLAGTVTVSLVGGQLRIAIPAATALGYAYDPVLAPVSPRNFLLTIGGMAFQATFVHVGDGEPTWLRTRIFVAERAPAGVLASAARPSRAAASARLAAALRAAR